MSKLVLITGGTKGIGKAIATCLAKSGFDLLLTYANDTKKAQEVQIELEKYNVNVALLQADATDIASIDIIDDYIKQNNCLLQSVICNAGITCRDSFEQISFEDWNRVFTANIHYPVFLLQRVINSIHKGGCVLFTGSLMGIEPHSVSLSYGVTKSSVHALVKNLVKFLAPYELRVNAVAPGFVDTEWQKNKPAEIRQNIERKVALGRFCDPNELAEVYKMLINNSYINGEVVVVDGGYSYK